MRFCTCAFVLLRILNPFSSIVKGCFLATRRKNTRTFDLLCNYGARSCTDRMHGRERKGKRKEIIPCVSFVQQFKVFSKVSYAEKIICRRTIELVLLYNALASSGPLDVAYGTPMGCCTRTTPPQVFEPTGDSEVHELLTR